MFSDVPRPGLARRVVVKDCDVGVGTDLAEFVVLSGCTVGRDCRIHRFVNADGCVLGDGCTVGPMVELREGSTIGDGCRVHSHAFVCRGATVGDGAVIGHGAKLVDVPPPGVDASRDAPVVREGARIGANATVLPVEIGRNAIAYPGAVVTEDVPADAVVAGTPAEVVGYRDEADA